MRSFVWRRAGFLWLGTAFAAASLTGVLSVLHASASVAGMAYLVFLVWFATQFGTVLSLGLAVLSALLFDFCFLEPRYSLTLSGSESWVSMLAFLVSCVVVTRVAERARRETLVADQRRSDVERLYTLSQEMMLHEDAEGLVRDVPRLVERIFALEAVLIYARDEDKLYSSIPGDSTRDPADSAVASRGLAAPTPGSVEAILQALREAASSWEPNAELPGGYAPMNLVFGMKSVGTLAWKPATLSVEVATSVAAQVAIAIARAHAIEVSTRLEAARSADRLRTALIDSLTHELRTPLTAIRAAATTLLDGRGLDGETRTELATIVDEESARLDELIGEAMEMAEVDAKTIRVRPEPLHTGTFLEQIVQELHEQLARHQVTTITEQPDEPVWFDPQLIGRVLHHLLENAVRYTPVGSRILVRSRRAPGRVEFVVEDDGPGIDPHDLPHVFDKFYRGSGRRSSGRAAVQGAVKGSGMGLAIVRAILTAHGGAIEVTSGVHRGPRSGTVFRFWVPGEAGVGVKGEG